MTKGFNYHPAMKLLAVLTPLLLLCLASAQYDNCTSKSPVAQVMGAENIYYHNHFRGDSASGNTIFWFGSFVVSFRKQEFFYQYAPKQFSYSLTFINLTTRFSKQRRRSRTAC